MAFCNKVGSLLRHSISQNGQPPITSMLNSFRCMSSSRIFVGGLSHATKDQALRDAFSGFGDVVSAKAIMDNDTGNCRGFGFVLYSSEESANEAVSAMDGQEINGRRIHVSHATDRPAGPRSFSGSRYCGDRGFGGGDAGI